MSLRILFAIPFAAALVFAPEGTAAEPTTQLVPVSSAAEELFAPRLTAGLAGETPVLDGNIGDPVWISIPGRRFLNSVSGAAPDAATEFQMTYDKDQIYMAFRAFEKGQETQRHAAVARDSSAIFSTDCVEIFLQPGGHGTPYYQIVVNPGGALWDRRWEEPGVAADWDGNIRAAGDEQADTWTLEVAIPFADLDMAPRASTSWRLNVCRTETPSGEYTCWSPTRGGYHFPERFGYLEFGVHPEEATAVTDGDHQRTARSRWGRLASLRRGALDPAPAQADPVHP